MVVCMSPANADREITKASADAAAMRETVFIVFLQAG